MTLLTDIASQLGWTNDSGPVPGVWRACPAGHRALWSVKWATSSGLLQPDDLLPLDWLSVLQAEAELDDLRNRSYGPGDRTIEKANQYYDQVTAIEAITPGCVNWLSQARNRYPEYDAPWDMPLEGQFPQATFRDESGAIRVIDKVRSAWQRPGWAAIYESGPLWIHH